MRFVRDAARQAAARSCTSASVGLGGDVTGRAREHEADLGIGHDVLDRSDGADAIATAASGIVQLTPGVTARLLRRSETSDSQVGDEAQSIAELTRRERDVLRVLATGATNRQIGDELNLSTGTVKNHVSAILRRLGIADRTTAAVIASRHDLD